MMSCPPRHVRVHQHPSTHPPVSPTRPLLCAALATALLSAVPALAQKAIGLRAGATFSSYKMTGDLDEAFDGGGGIGYYAELDFNLPFGTSGLSVMPLVGVNILQTATYSSEIDASLAAFPIPSLVIDEGRDEITSLAIAALFRYRIPGKSVTPYFEAGPYLRFNLSGTHFVEGQRAVVADRTVGYAPFDIDDEIEFGSSSSDVYRPSSFTLAFGTGLMADLEFGTLSLGARYIGVGNVRSAESTRGPAGASFGLLFDDASERFAEYGDSDKLRLRTLELTVGFAIPLGGY